MSYPKRKTQYGAYALDSRGSILHYDPSIKQWGLEMLLMTRDVELQLLGAVEVRVVNPSWEKYFPVVSDPRFIYQDWDSVLNAKYKEKK